MENTTKECRHTVELKYSEGGARIINLIGEPTIEGNTQPANEVYLSTPQIVELKDLLEEIHGMNRSA